MTEKEKSIEELARVFLCVHVPRRLCPKAIDCTRCLAESVLELGYEKIPKDAVVLTQEEWQDINARLCEVELQKDAVRQKVASDVLAEVRIRSTVHWAHIATWETASWEIDEEQLRNIALDYGLDNWRGENAFATKEEAEAKKKEQQNGKTN